MRISAPLIGALAIAVAAALVWRFRPEPEQSLVSDAAPVSVPAEPVAARAGGDRPDDPAPDTPDVRSDTRQPVTEPAAAPIPAPAAAPLPGQAPATPMAQLLADREREFPPELAEGEREFAAEPVDGTWAPGAEADVLAKFAEMPGLRLLDLQVECRSTMCRLQLTQPAGAQDANGARPFNILLDSIGYEPRWMMAIADRSNTMRSIAYLWREGFAPERPADPDETD